MGHSENWVILPANRFESSYVIIEDFYSIGEESRDNIDEERHDQYTELIKTPRRQPAKPVDGDERYGSTRRRILEVPGSHSQQNEHQREGNDSFPLNSTPDTLRGLSPNDKEVLLDGPSKKIFSPLMKSPSSDQKKRKREEPFDEIDPNLTPRIVKITKLAEEMFASRKNSTDGGNTHNSPPELQSHRPAAAKHIDITYEKPGNQTNIAPKPKLEVGREEIKAAKTHKVTGDFRAFNSGNPVSRHPAKDPEKLLPIKRPLSIRPLSSLTGSHATRNKVHDVFAVICAVDDSVIKPPAMPLKRDIRIMDRSTDKKVLVSVFVDPAKFKPAVGTVALFRSLTTHEWDRGMLNVYPQQCAGREWFVADPIGVEGCDVVGLREWWERKRDFELERQS